MRRIRVAALLILVAPACGWPGSGGPLATAGDKLGDIRSGVMNLRLVAATRSGSETGFAISGPFSLPSDESLIEADLNLRQLGPQAAPQVRFVSTGEAAYVEVEGKTYQLPPEQAESLRGDAEAGEGGPFDGLDLDSWVIDPEVTEGEELDAVETQTIRGRLDVVAAAQDLFDMARDFGGVSLPAIEGEEAERLSDAVESSSLEVVTGREDGLLRRLDIQVDLAASAPERLEPALSDLLGVGFELLLEIEDPNEPVQVTPPE